jgi:hypothetical protein
MRKLTKAMGRLSKEHPSVKIKPTKSNDPVNHPAHYTDGQIEVIDFIEDKKLPYHLGNVIKYICRAGKKDPGKTVEDLQKASWYLNRYIRYIRKVKKVKKVK